MMRKNGIVFTKRWLAVLLATIFFVESGLVGTPAGQVLAEEAEEITVSADAPCEEEVTIESQEQAADPGEKNADEEIGQTSEATIEDKETVEADVIDDSFLWPEETDGTVVFDTEELLPEESSFLANTETKKVDVDPTSIAQTQIYKDMDYSFLKEYPFGQSNAELAQVTFGSAEELKKSKDVRLVSGKIIRTEGYYESGDGGGAVYEIMSEWSMGQADRKEGSIGLTNGLYACIIPDVCEIGGEKWVAINIKQLGARGDGVTPSQDALTASFAAASKHAAKNEDIARGLAYIPAGEYKCTNEIFANGLNNVNIVGDGDSSVLFTDNDYRKDYGYSEFLFASWNTKNTYFGDFRIEAREVDLYNYMRQFVLVYCDNIYIYHVDLIIPQETYSAYYFQDKQYSNFCCYSGDTNITVDGCTMIQFSGTYRGANVGIMDFWDREVKNITVMNCDLYSNARDEQIGIFNIPKTGTHVNENTSISNIDLINNSIHTIPVKYREVIGNQNMCFTVAYGDSVRIDDVRIAGNHFICEADSKFMTFGTITNCVVENNIIEILATWSTGASIFDSSNSDENNILIRNNEFFLTSVDGKRGKAGFVQGKMTFEGNKVFSDTTMVFGIVGDIARDNEFVFLEQVGSICGGVAQVENNTYYLYAGTSGGLFSLGAASGWKDVSIKNNTVYDYKRSFGLRGVWDSMVGMDAWDSKETAEFSGNRYYAPNRKYTNAYHYTMRGVDEEVNLKEDVDWVLDENGKQKITAYYNRMFYMRGPDNNQVTLKKVVFSNNVLQGVKGYTEYNKPATVEYVLSGNTTLPYREDLSEDEPYTSSIDMLYNGQKVTEISVTGDTVKLDKIVRIATRDEEGNIQDEQVADDREIRWYTSVESMASVSETGTVTRKMYGDVKVYAVPTDGSGIHGACTIHFLKNAATGISVKKDHIDLQPGLKYYADYEVLPKEEASQNLNWTSSNEEIATVSKTGLITAQAVGTAVITGTTTDGSNLSASITVQVTPVTVKKMGMDHTWLYFTEEQIGESEQLSVANYTPDNATNKEVKRWESTDTDVAVVDSQGKVTVVGSGLAQIRAYSTDEYCYATCNVYVEPAQVKNFAVTATGKNAVALGWEPVEKCYGYNLYQWDSDTGTWKKLNGGRSLGRDKTSFTVSDLDADTEYKFCIRSYYQNWTASPYPLYESKDSVVTVKTYSYQPVTSIKGSEEVFTVIGLGETHQREYTIYYSPSSDNFADLDFTYKIEDEGIAKIVSVEDGSDAGRKNIVIEGTGYGMTMLIVTSTDERHTSVRIPVGVVPTDRVQNCTVEGVYKKAIITFDGFEDESGIDGYYIRLKKGYRWLDIDFVGKTGAASYRYTDKNVEAGKGYAYNVYPCVTDGTHYATGNAINYDGIGADIPEPVQATSLEMGQTTYVVKGGETIEVSARVGNADASTNELYWEVVSEKYASVERQEKEGEETLTDYADVTGIAAGVTRLKAVTTDGSEIEASARLIVAPSPVKNLKAESSLNNVSLCWDAVMNAEGYTIYRWDENGKKFEKIAEARQCDYRDTGLKANTSYRYKIAAYITVDGEKYEGESTGEIGVATASEDYGIYATGYAGVYDGRSHAAVTVSGVKKAIDTVTYSVDGKNWSEEVPFLTNVKESRDIYVKVEREGQTKPYQITVAAVVSPYPIAATDVGLKTGSTEWDGKSHTPEVFSEMCALGTDYTVGGLKAYKNTGVYAVTVTGIGNYTGTKELTYEIKVVKGHKYKVSGYYYRITGSKTVAVAGLSNKKKTSATVKSTVKIGGRSYQITAIDASAFKNCKKLRKVTIGSNVTSIGKNAFYGDRKLKKIVIKTKKLKKIGKNALKGIAKTAQIQMPKSKRNKYKKLFKKSTGYVTSMKLK